jgi:peptide/nickel transport system ATP-binding protein
MKLSVKHLSVGIHTERGTVRAVRDVSFDVAAGETIALVGESGCGKSMTALALMRLLPPGASVTAGEVLLDEMDLLSLAEREMRGVRGGLVSIIFQDPATGLNPVMTVGDQIAEVLLLHGCRSRREAHDEARLWLERVGIDRPQARMKAFPHELSGGQKQRVMIAMALAARPKVVIADEPTTALDVTLQAQVLELLKELQREQGVALILITHDLAVVEQMADRVALMYAGEILEEAGRADFFAHPLHPYARRLLAAVPEEGKKGRPLEGIPGMVPDLANLPEGCAFCGRCPLARDECREAPVPLAAAAGSRLVRCRYPGEKAETVQREVLNGVPPGESVLTIGNLSVTYESGGGLFSAPRRFEAVKGVSLSLRAGETLALVGESGSGKTTIGKAVLGLLSGHARISGRVEIAGSDAFGGGRAGMQRLRRAAQIIFQDPFASLDPRMTIGESIAEGVRALGVEKDPERIGALVRELLLRVGLPEDSAHRLPHEFSGGQRQRIAIARALAVQPRLIICDEPTSALDVSVQAQILNLMKEIQRERGVAYLFITHNFAVVEYLADRVAVMKDGEIVETGGTAELMRAPRTEYSARLLAAVPRLRSQKPGGVLAT